MVSGRRKSRTFTRKQVHLAGGKTITRYNRRKPGKSQCADCGDYLKGMSQRFPGKMQNTAISKKRPSRPFGGVLCSTCMRKKIVGKFRNILSLSSK
ncbi:TPA: 50S ribosomal protein L34e [Candidatus Woesearchaeota archaeon]|nr:50S ribosomal protein L34e [Candidatus Woesearchaeota archaeon]HIH39926.1 50S ribosomal protein L34e [Candidatus Woesearchaeota archaeon]